MIEVMKRYFGNTISEHLLLTLEKAEVKETSYKEIEDKITDKETLKAFQAEQEAYKEREAEFKA